MNNDDSLLNTSVVRMKILRCDKCKMKKAKVNNNGLFACIKREYEG